MILEDNNLISVNSKVVRSVNRAMILNLIRERQPISRVKISRLTTLNKSTVSSIVSDLLDEGFIYEKATEDQNIGRNPIDLYLRVGKFFVGAINIDSSVTRLAIFDIDGKLITKSFMATKPTDPGAFIESILNELLILSKKNNINELEAIGISITGVVDSVNLTVRFAPNLGWENIDIGQIIKERFEQIKNISIINDAKASALAELWFGNHKVNLSNFVFLSIGPGIGSGIVVKNQILDGEYLAAGEFGHATLFEKGKKCVCGNYGCWEAYASEKSITEEYINRLNLDKTNGLDDKSTKKIQIQDIIDLANDGEEIALESLKKSGYYLGIGISNIIKSIDPHAIIIGGKITQVWDIIYPIIEEIVEKRAFQGNYHTVNIFPTSLEVKPRLLGAATIAIKTIFDDYKIIV